MDLDRLHKMLSFGYNDKVDPDPVAVARQTWADTETTTKLWSLISSGDEEALQALIDEDSSVAVQRSADGRGPLWCAAYAAFMNWDCLPF